LKLFGAAGVALLTVSVYETGFVIVQFIAFRCGDRVFGDRFAGGGQPLLPFGVPVVPAEKSTDYLVTASMELLAVGSADLRVEAVPVAAVVAHALRIARRIGNEFEIRPVEARELLHFIEREHAVDLEHAVVSGSERALHAGTLTAAERWLLYYSLRASEVEIPNAWPRSVGRWTTSPAVDQLNDCTSSGRARWTCTRSNASSAARAAAAS